MVEWCAQARSVWNMALAQRHAWCSWMGPIGDQKRFLTDARAELGWLKAGPSVVQQQAILDLRQAVKNYRDRPDHFAYPTWRKAGINEGFTIRDVKVRRLNKRWATLLVPKLGPVRFRLHRPMPATHGMGRVTLDRSGRWHVSFSAIPDQIDGPGDGTVVGVDRGVKVGFQASDGRAWSAPGLTPGEARRLRLLQRRLARQEKGSKRRARTKTAIARLRAREADRRKDTIEKATTDLARTADVVRIEVLPVRQMMASARGTIEHPGRNVAQKTGLNRGISEQGWTLFTSRLGDKIGDRLQAVPAAYTSQRCHDCGHTEAGNRESQAVFRCRGCGHTANADVNAALNIRDHDAAGRPLDGGTPHGVAVPGRGRTGATRPPCEASTSPTTQGHHHAS